MYIVQRVFVIHSRDNMYIVQRFYVINSRDIVDQLLLTYPIFVCSLPLKTFHRKRARAVVEAEEVDFNATSVAANRDLELDAVINQAITLSTNVPERCPDDDATSPIKENVQRSHPKR